MRSRTGWHGRVAIWAGWLLGGALLLVLAVGAMTLSTDGARLKRLFADTGAGGEPPHVVAASYELPAAVLPAGPRAETVPSPAFVGPPEAPVSTVAGAKGPGGCVLAEVIGPSNSVEVLLDGEWKGVAPVLIDRVVPGLHRLTFQSGSANWDEEVTVSAGDTTLVACVAPAELISGIDRDSTLSPTPSRP